MVSVILISYFQKWISWNFVQLLTKWFFIITLNNHCVVLLKCGRWINPFHATVLLLYLPESIRKSLVFWCLQGVKKETSDRNWTSSNRSTVFNWGKQQNVKSLKRIKIKSHRFFNEFKKLKTKEIVKPHCYRLNIKTSVFHLRSLFFNRCRSSRLEVFWNISQNPQQNICDIKFFSRWLCNPAANNF